MREIHGSDAVGQPHVQELEGEKRKVLGTEIRVRELRYQSPGERAHDAQRRKHAGYVRHRNTRRQVFLEPHFATGLLNCRRDHHVAEI